VLEKVKIDIDIDVEFTIELMTYNVKECVGYYKTLTMVI